MKKLPVRERLIETASELFYANGYNSTGINEILEKSGVAKASMYQHFRSKEEICVEFLRVKEIQHMEGLEEHMNKFPPGPQRLVSPFYFLQAFFETDGFRGCWCQNTLSELPKDNENVMGEIRAQKKRFIQWVKTMVEENLSSTAADPLATKLYMLYEAALIESQLYMEDWPITTAREMAKSLLDT